MNSIQLTILTFGREHNYLHVYMLGILNVALDYQFSQQGSRLETLAKPLVWLLPLTIEISPPPFVVADMAHSGEGGIFSNMNNAPRM